MGQKATSGQIVYLQVRVVQLGDTPRDRQAETAAFAGVVLAAIKALDQLGQILSGYPLAGVTHAQHHLTIIRADEHGNRLPRLGIAQGVFDQVTQGDAQQLGIA